MPDTTLQKMVLLDDHRLDSQLVAYTNDVKTTLNLKLNDELKSPKFIPQEVTWDDPVEGPLVSPPTELTTAAS
jgi:hypothetical protein